MLLPVLLSCAAFQVSPSSAVIVVDASGAGDFTTVQAAVDAAQGGEVILVRPGPAAYAGFEVVGKALVITSDTPGVKIGIQSGVRVANLASGQEVVLAGLSVTGELGVRPDALSLASCLGSVRIEGCMLQGASNVLEPRDCSGYDANQGYDGAHVAGSLNVAFVSCALAGGRGVVQAEDPVESCGYWTPGGTGGEGLEVSSSSVAAYDSSFTGGEGGKGGWGGLGGDGILTRGAGQLVLSGAASVGGKGGVGFDWLYGPGGDGGMGLDTSSTTYLLGGSFSGGPGGGSVLFPDGSAGVSIQGATTAWAGAPRSLQVGSPAHEGSTLKLTFHGQPGDYVLLFVSISQSFQLYPAYQGVALIGTPKVFPAGQCDASGALQITVPVPPLNPSYEAAVLAAQPAFISTAAEIVAGPFGHAVLLDAAF